MYGAMLPHVMHRADLNYLIDMMGAEIAIGHSFVRGGDMPDVPQSVVGQLGADFTIENGRYKITKIYDAVCTRCGAEPDFPEVALAPESLERTPTSR